MKAPVRYQDLPDPTSAEIAARDLAATAQAARPVRTSINLAIDADGKADLSNPDKDGKGWSLALQETFASTSVDFVNDAIGKLRSVVARCDGTDGAALNAALALIGGVEPENEAQAAIAVQIAIAHAASVQMTAKALANVSHFEAASSYAGMATKFSRTMVAHVEALAKLRGGGRQIIEHRYINVTAENAVVGDNTQAIFGGAPQGVDYGNQHQPHERSDRSCEPLAALSCPKPSGKALPSPSDEGAEAVPLSRRPKPRRA